MEITAEQEERILRATEDFKKAMQIRSSMSLRVAKRVTAMLRIGMVSFGVVTVILLLMLYAFTSKMDEMIAALNTMNIEFSSMSHDMTTIRSTLSSLERNVSHVPAITQETINITGSVGEMRTEVDNIKAIVAKLNNEVHGITSQVSNMTREIRLIDPAVQHMGRDVNRMSGPMRMFNMFNPAD